jgi:protein-S-isoprenylcysteine O-methyltransferase Ste14
MNEGTPENARKGGKARTHVDLGGILRDKFDSRIMLGSFLFPIPLVVDWIIGGFLLFLGIVIWWRWSKLWQEKDRVKIVTYGLYRYVRHPHYLSIIVVSFGVTFLMQSLIFLLFIFLTSIALYKEAEKEEKQLIKIYGEQYREYMEKVRWRFTPGVI